MPAGGINEEPDSARSADALSSNSASSAGGDVFFIRLGQVLRAGGTYMPTLPA
jgi:hypothetical protein